MRSKLRSQSATSVANFIRWGELSRSVVPIHTVQVALHRGRTGRARLVHLSSHASWLNPVNVAVARSLPDPDGRPLANDERAWITRLSNALARAMQHPIPSGCSQTILAAHRSPCPPPCLFPPGSCGTHALVTLQDGRVRRVFRELSESALRLDACPTPTPTRECQVGPLRGGGPPVAADAGRAWPDPGLPHRTRRPGRLGHQPSRTRWRQQAQGRAETADPDHYSPGSTAGT